MGEWRYSSTFLDLGTRWRLVISSTPLPLYPPAERAPVKHWIGVWVGPRVGLNATEKRKILHCRELNPGNPSRSPLLYRLSYTVSFPYTSPPNLYTVFRINWTCATCTANHMLSDLMLLIHESTKYEVPSCSVCNLFNPPVTFSFLDPNILNILLSNIVNPCPSLEDGQLRVSEKKLVRSSNMLHMTISCSLFYDAVSV
jgi:hypothetical protein